jgi:3-hydroxybutyryl-CoA dehydrogenase
MGAGIAQVAATSGRPTILFDLNPDMLNKAKQGIAKQLAGLAEKKRMSEQEAAAVQERIQFTTAVQDCKADLVIEAIIENKEAKIGLFNQLSAINGPATIFATNTSSISINEIATALAVVERFMGMHFFNPAPVMKLVELVKTESTDNAVVEALLQLCKEMGKIAVVCKDAPGFIVNRVARPFYLEAMELVSAEHVPIETIDAAMENIGFKMGPFKLMDLIGLDINYSVSQIVWEALGKPDRLKPSALQGEKVKEGNLGRKTGQGFYRY